MKSDTTIPRSTLIESLILDNKDLEIVKNAKPVAPSPRALAKLRAILKKADELRRRQLIQESN
jgi:hypothetical protein